MKRTALLLITLLLTGGAATAQSLAFTDVTVIDVAEGVAEPGMTVVITADRITAAGETNKIEVPPGATVIEGSGKFLIPGLWDMHAHSSSDSITREIILPLYIANGVTGVRDMKADCFEPCDEVESSIEQVRQWRREIASGELIGPRIVAGSALINGPDPGEESSVQRPATAEHARALVKLLEERGVDFIKPYSMLSREAYFALAEEARKRGIPVAGHKPVAVRTSETIDAGQRSIEHCCEVLLDECSDRGDELRDSVMVEARSERPRILPIVMKMVDSFSEERCAALYDRFVRTGTWFVPTLRIGFWQPFDWRSHPAARFLAPAEQAYWERHQKIFEFVYGGDPQALERLGRKAFEIVGAMHRAGVQILAGSDAGAPPAYWGFGLQEELELLLQAGLTQAEALRAATLSPARYLEATDSLGTVEAGKLADLVLLEANPLDDIANTRRISAVVARGRLFDRDALDALLMGAERAAKKE